MARAEARDLSKMENCICFNLRKGSRIVTQYYDSRLGRSGIRVTQGSILTALSMRANWSMSDLGRVLGQERTTLIRNIGLLRRKGLVAFLAEPGAPAGVAITAKGRQELEKIGPAWSRVQGAVTKVLGEQRWREILADLKRVSEVLSREAEK